MNLQVFDFSGSAVRTVIIDGEPLFVAKDVCEVLGYVNAADAIAKHCKGVAKRYPLHTQGGTQDLRILSEPDVLRLIIRSKLPAAEAFERWVFEEVLPTIRKTGQYATPDRSAQRCAMEAATAAATAVRRSVYAQLSRGVPAKDVRYLVSFYASADGEINFDGHGLRNGEVVGTWPELAGMLRAGQVGPTDTLEVAAAAVQTQWDRVRGVQKIGGVA